MKLLLEYTTTAHSPARRTFDGSSYGWVNNIRVGNQLTSPAAVCAGVLSEVEDIDIIDRATLITDDGEEVELPR